MYGTNDGVYDATMYIKYGVGEDEYDGDLRKSLSALRSDSSDNNDE